MANGDDDKPRKRRRLKNVRKVSLTTAVTIGVERANKKTFLFQPSDEAIAKEVVQSITEHGFSVIAPKEDDDE